MKIIIVIGAGRSGSTLLGRMLDSHPKINFNGETHFIVPRLWKETWVNRFWFNWELHTNSDAVSSINRMNNIEYLDLRQEIDVEISEDLQFKAQEKSATSIRQTLLTLFEVNQEKSMAWGFKEPWNGSSSFRYPWKIYDQVFPEAIWVHLIRNPFDQVRSNSMWNRKTLDFNALKNLLINWFEVVNFSRERKITNRFIEIKFEDLLISPQTTISPLLDTLELEWDKSCLEPIGKRTYNSSIDIPQENYHDLNAEQVEEIFENVLGLREICHELGYDFSGGIPDYFYMSKHNTKNPSLITFDPNQGVENIEVSYKRLLQELENKQRKLEATFEEIEKIKSNFFVILLYKLGLI